jgi:transposase
MRKDLIIIKLGISIQGITRRAALAVVEACDGNRNEAAEHLGVTPRTLNRWLQSCEEEGLPVPPRPKGTRGPDKTPRKRSCPKRSLTQAV